MSDTFPVKYESKEIQSHVDAFSNGLQAYLDQVGLPVKNVLVPVNERNKVLFIMPSVADNLTDEQKKKAYYISKFITSCCAGLFDAALNFLWNETILNLREKIVLFDLDYFYDSTIKDPSQRSNFKTNEDLENISDWDLIRGCRDTGIISDIGHKHLNYIRDMRNFASAAHPNHIELTGLQVVTWLETCIIEVLAKEPSGPVVDIKRLLYNIRTEKLSQTDVNPIRQSIQQLPPDLTNSLLQAIFGMYTDNSLSKNVRDNIDLISNTAWSLSHEDAKHKIGIKYATFSVNGDLKRKSLAHAFLNNVNGLDYLPEDQLSLEINERLDSLFTAHYEINNFYNEAPHVRALKKYIPETWIIPKTVRYKYVKVITICRLGNTYGISFAALPFYNEMIDIFHDEEILEFLELLNDKDIITILDDKEKYKTFIELTNLLENNTNDEIISDALLSLEDSSKQDIIDRKTYRKISKLISRE